MCKAALPDEVSALNDWFSLLSDTLTHTVDNLEGEMDRNVVADDDADETFTVAEDIWNSINGVSQDDEVVPKKVVHILLLKYLNYNKALH